MEYIPINKLPRKNRPCLMELPPYCRSTNRKIALERSAVPVKLEVSDPSKLLQFVESLKDNNSKSLEKKINKYVSRLLNNIFGDILSFTLL